MNLRIFFSVIAIFLASTLVGTPKPSPVHDYRVELYKHRNFKGKLLNVRRGKSYSKLGNLNDEISSIRYKIPDGDRVVLHEHSGFEGKGFEMRGTGKIEEIPDLRDRGFNDRASSIRWYKN